MAWDKDAPAGSLPLNVSDDVLRANQTALEAMVNVEHTFSTGGTAAEQGRHKFGIGLDAARAAAITSPTVGNMWFNTKDYVAHGWYIGQVYAEISTGPSVYAWVDIGPFDAALARTDEAKVWTQGQAGAWVAFTEDGTAAPLYDWDWDLDDGNFFYETLPDSSTVTIKLPTVTGLVDNANGATVMFKITQAPTTAGTLVFESGIEPSGGFQPALSTTLGTVHLVSMVMLSATSFIYTVTEV